jgi:hypothetical protein
MNIDLTGVSVTIGMPMYRAVPPKTLFSVVNTVIACGSMGVNCNMTTSDSTICEWARDGVLNSFLTGDKQKLFWIDSDMVWAPDDFVRMLALSTVHDVVAAAYPLRNIQPNTYQVGHDENPETDRFGLIKVNALGLGFCVIDRKVAEAVSAKAEPAFNRLTGNSTPAVFRVGVVGGDRTGEDVIFFNDVRAAGFDVWLDPSIELGHVGEHEWRGRFADTLMKPKEIASDGIGW